MFLFSIKAFISRFKIYLLLQCLVMQYPVSSPIRDFSSALEINLSSYLSPFNCRKSIYRQSDIIKTSKVCMHDRNFTEDKGRIL